MLKDVLSRNLITLVSGGVLAAVLAAGAAKAVTDTIFRYDTPRTGYLMLDPVGFAPLTTDAANHFGIFYYYNGYISVTAQNQCFGTSVNLPHGSKMTDLTIWYEKGTQVTLIRHEMSDGTTAQIADGSFTNAQAGIRTRNIAIAPALQTVNNRLYGYGLVACLNDTQHYFRGARITYTYTHAGD